MQKIFVLSCGLLAITAIAHADPALTIYNQNFGVVRDTLPLNLNAGDNKVQLSDVTAQLETDSVILRDPTGQRPLQVLEQFYGADPVSQAYLLSLYEGKTIDFRVQRGDHEEIVKGKIIRSGYQLPVPNQGYQGGYYGGTTGQPVVEVNGQLRFSLPGEPLFPALPQDTILKPTLNWVLRTPVAGPLNAELAYVSRGLTWEADYNIVAPPLDDPAGVAGFEKLELTGWVTLTNTCGKTFENASLKLMAGDVSKMQPPVSLGSYAKYSTVPESWSTSNPQVTQKVFDEYHLYTLPDRTTLRDRETKQVEFLRASGVKCETIYVYDGAQIESNGYSSTDYSGIRQDRSYGTKTNRKVWVMRSFDNTRANGLGMPLPKGRMRFYRRDTDGQLEFTGENTIDHTPEGETVRVNTGNAFDLTGDRKQTNFKYDSENRTVDESFQITLHNRKKQPVEIRVVEHMYRGTNWSLSQQSNISLKRDASTMEFTVQVPPEEDKVLTYTVRYTW